MAAQSLRLPRSCSSSRVRGIPFCAVEGAGIQSAVRTAGSVPGSSCRARLCGESSRNDATRGGGGMAVPVR